MVKEAKLTAQNRPDENEIDSASDFDAEFADLSLRVNELSSIPVALEADQEKRERNYEFEKMILENTMPSAKESGLPRTMEETEKWLNEQNLKVLRKERIALEIEKTRKQRRDLRTSSEDPSSGSNGRRADDKDEGFAAMKLLTNADPDVKKFAVMLMSDIEYQKIAGNMPLAFQIRVVVLRAKLALKKPITDEDKVAFGTSNGGRELEAFLKNYPFE